jgi:hypothetical protein
MKRRSGNFPFVFKITLLSILIVLGKLWQKSSSPYFYNHIDAIQVTSDTANNHKIPADSKYVLLKNVSWQVKD